MMRTALIVGGLLFALGVTNLQIVQKERLLTSGESMLLQLAPVDPRSLIEGDYMRLEYAIVREVGTPDGWPRDGQLVVAPDAEGVARFVRRLEPGASPGPGERLLQYRIRNGHMQIGTNAFFFQEGHADRYSAARYGELKVDAGGTGLLVGLRDASRQPLGAEPSGQP
jgi:uncharacterized membrane-anchored protein